MHFRPAQSGDAVTIAELNLQLAWETEHLRLDAATVLRGVRRGLARSDDVQYWVAETEPRGGAHSAVDTPSQPQLAGQLMLTREWSDWRDGWILWLQSVYVRSEFRGQGVFRMLLNHVIHEVRQQPDICGLRLYVENTNERAKHVYENLDFSDAGYRVMERMF